MDAREYEAACPLLERSHTLDPSSGTVLNLGDCYEQRGMTASAYRAFEEARELSNRTGRTDRAEIAGLRKKRLEPLLRQLIIVPPKDHSASLVVYLDGKPLAPSSWYVPVPIDPGLHAIRASAPGAADFDTSVSAPSAGSTSSVSIPPLQPLAEPSPGPGSGRVQQSGSRIDGQRIVAIVCAAVGVVGVATGTVFGLRSKSKHEESDEYCTGNSCQNRRGVELMDDARSAGNISTVGFIVGGVGLGAATVLWVTSPSGSEPVAAEIGLGPAAIQVRGRW
jgi:serine/threonine-protein kinase